MPSRQLQEPFQCPVCVCVRVWGDRSQPQMTELNMHEDKYQLYVHVGTARICT